MSHGHPRLFMPAVCLGPERGYAYHPFFRTHAPPMQGLKNFFLFNCIHESSETSSERINAATQFFSTSSAAKEGNPSAEVCNKTHDNEGLFNKSAAYVFSVTAELTRPSLLMHEYDGCRRDGCGNATRLLHTYVRHVTADNSQVPSTNATRPLDRAHNINCV